MGLPAVFVQKIQHAMVVIPGIVLTMTGAKIGNALWKKALHIVRIVGKIATKGS